MADIDIEPSALTDFARNSKLDLDVDALQRIASAASNGQSHLPEGNDLFNAQRAAIQQVMDFFSQAKVGNQAYRDAADQMAARYTMTEDQMAATMRAAATPVSDSSSDSAASA